MEIWGWGAFAAAGAIALLAWLVFTLLGRSQTKRPSATPPRSHPSKVKTQATGQRYLVIGGNGFLGSHIVEALLARGEDDIVIFDAAESDFFKGEPNVSFMKGSILNSDHLDNVCCDRDVVYHTAAMLNYWSRLQHDFDAVYQVNFVGTKNVVEACRKAGVKKLLFPSSASIFVTPETLQKPIHGLSEDEAGYPKGAPLCHYTHTKLLAEKFVLAANGVNGLLTGVIRPNAIYGPRDLFSNLIGGGYPGVGTPNNKQDYAYVENVVHGFFKLEENLTPGSPAAGQAYFISDDLPVNYLDFAGQFGRRFGHTFSIVPRHLATFLAHTVELIARLTKGRLPLGQLTMLTPPTLVVSRAEYYFSVEKAKRVLGWRPLFTPEEGIDLSVNYYTARKAGRSSAEGRKKQE